MSDAWRGSTAEDYTPEAFRMMQKLAMDKRKSMKQIADAILLTES